MLAALAVGSLVAFLSVPLAWRSGIVWPDSVHYLGIANAWVHGAGFVDPVKWSYYLAAPVPQPALVTRAAVPPLLAAIPLALGGSVATVAAWHAALLGVAAASLVLIARRMMGLTASVCVALVVTVSPATAALAQVPLADIPALVALVSVLASARGVVASSLGAALCALATVVGWATRPNLALAAPVVVAVAAWELGPRRAVRCAPLWTYVAAVAGSLAAVDLAVRTATGYAPYAGYGFVYQMSSFLEATRFDHAYVGAARYVLDHAGEVAARMLWNVRELGDELFRRPDFRRVGWLALPGAAYCLLRDGRGRFERRLCALAGLVFASFVVATWMVLDRLRFPLPIVLCGALCGGAMVDDVVRAVAGRFVARRSRAVTALAVVLLAALSWGWLVTSGGRRLATSAAHVAHWARGGAPIAPERRRSAALLDLCASIPRNAVVAARDPWSVHLACGNPAIILPADIEQAASRQRRFLVQQRPHFVLTMPRDRRSSWVRRPDLRLVARSGGAALYEVVPSRGRPARWTQPPPLLCAGRPPECLARVGR